jgi:hypothetical protein
LRYARATNRQLGVPRARQHERDLANQLAPGLGYEAVHLRVGQRFAHFLHAHPGNDLVLIGTLGAVGLASGVASGFATPVRAGDNGHAVARVGWIAGALLIAGIGSRMVFAYAVSHGARHAITSFS